MSIKEKLMVLRDGGIAIIAIIAAIAAIGYGTHKITKKSEHPVEEIAEDIIENMIEEALNLPEGMLDIDLSPDSEEEK